MSPKHGLECSKIVATSTRKHCVQPFESNRQMKAISCSHRVCRFEHLGMDKTAEQLLMHSEASLRAMIENAGMTIYSLDRNFRYIHFNSYLKESLRKIYNVEIKIGDVIFDFLAKDSPAEAAEWHSVYSRALAGEPLEFVKEFNVEGYHSFLKFYVNPIRERNEVTGLTCIALDITKERLAELEINRIADDLLKRNHHLEQYSYIIAHNLRAPIANLLGIANLVEMPGASAVDKEEAKSYILNAVRRLDLVIRDLNDILQAKEEVNLHRESIQFEAITKDVIASVQSLITKSGATIVMDFESHPGMITIKSYLNSIFYNLICNCIMYSRPGNKPTILISSLLL
jgi:PAS domain S-box-containing protein